MRIRIGGQLNPTLIDLPVDELHDLQRCIIGELFRLEHRHHLLEFVLPGHSEQGKGFERPGTL